MGATIVKNGNLLDALPTQGTLHVVMLGLDSAGKTTALYRLKFDQYLNTVPTIGFNCEKVQGTLGKAKGVHFLVWDVGGQEKLRPLWRSYTRCTDGILFVVDSVDTERMEEAKMELMRTAKCPDNQGVPVLILANKQDLPSACCPKQLENLLGLHELHYPISNLSSTSTSTSTGNIAGFATSNQSYTDYGKTSLTNVNKDTDNSHVRSTDYFQLDSESTFSHADSKCKVSSSPAALSNPQQQLTLKHTNLNVKGWYIQPACAITGEGLQEGLDALYDMILKRRKINKNHKKNKR
ncbi:ADP-ribosylation factor-like protein 4C isoform X2 [Drosophila navojoa]|uniref:ADP-ribosylation factor-like protein 4C isoform X1 n=1 Tax=Drosophila navojoa TaxID=7232 RepID=UPI0011BF8053|nr:ADP-ribosylation factor-like protein 4C isoform X1 [Drosophila navojoa]XP_030244147.1 ADP-ribosylation factor-like protein 4C isoform X2 [Drosophila navojoa]